ncbi:MAG TPA: MGMT family protein [Ohtaekwangia sp.]|uniref:MGMT family protein n=1 Tax=Ohtaekwangia sp. TaxID=2066019 RepID=UPI002F956F5D
MPRTKKKQTDKNFFTDVYEVARLIPAGRATSYGAIGAYLGLKSSARMVGWAMFGCPKDVPAHRVVNSKGLLTAKHHFKPPGKMQKLLEKEGVKVVNDKIVGFNEVFWDPLTELTLDGAKPRKKRPKNG